MAWSRSARIKTLLAIDTVSESSSKQVAATTGILSLNVLALHPVVMVSSLSVAGLPDTVNRQLHQS